MSRVPSSESAITRSTAETFVLRSTIHASILTFMGSRSICLLPLEALIQCNSDLFRVCEGGNDGENMSIGVLRSGAKRTY